ncbi:MAG: hypothetical protein LC662_03515 [Rhodothermaceae bacterium]|nr:hypothetical protein [Rhodothermaceae bacterium]
MSNKDSLTESRKTVTWNIRSQGLLKTVLEIDIGDTEPVTVKTSLFKNAAEFELNGNTYNMESISLFKGRYVLNNGNEIIAEAEKKSVWSCKYKIRFMDVWFGLNPESIFRSGYKIFYNGIEIGSVKKKSIWNYSAIMNIPASFDRAFGIFLFWVIFVTWKQNNAAAAASG